jgi:tRNA(Ile)-lysidine synthase
MDIFEDFKNSLFKIISPTDQVLAAVSGGIDSMVMVDLLRQTEVDFAIAHCNFQLRGEESEADENFVRLAAADMGVPFFGISFETRLLATQQKLSVQEMARELRYAWLEDTQQKNGYHWIATAHHLSDNAETILLNLAKGTGLRGLAGIPPRRGSIIRPMLRLRRSDIEAYAAANQIAFREDSSNKLTKYTRNKIRHQIVPELENLNPEFLANLGQTAEHLRQAREIFEFAIRKWKEEILQETFYGFSISNKKLLNLPAPPTILFEMLKDFGFNSDQCGQIFRAIEAQPGKSFFSTVWTLTTGSEFLFLSRIADSPDSAGFLLTATMPGIDLPEGRITLEKVTASERKFTEVKPDRNTIFIDASQVNFPLVLRRWEPGDNFQPLGLGGSHQKVQDFLTNQKVPVPEKRQIWMLESAGQILWIVGWRMSEICKVTPSTKYCLKITFKPTERL